MNHNVELKSNSRSLRFVDTNNCVTRKRDGKTNEKIKPFKNRCKCNTGRIEPHLMCGTEKTQVARCTCNTTDWTICPEIGRLSRDRLANRGHRRQSLTVCAHNVLFVPSASLTASIDMTKTRQSAQAPHLPRYNPEICWNTADRV